MGISFETVNVLRQSHTARHTHADDSLDMYFDVNDCAIEAEVAQAIDNLVVLISTLALLKEE